MVRGIIPNDIHLANQNNTADDHRNSDDRQIDTRELETLNADVFSRENVAPQETSQRRAKSRTESTVVDAKCH